MGYGYQKHDDELVDFQLWKMDGLTHLFRGPKPVNLNRGEFFICMGAAQTFGRFVPKPFPALVAEKLNLQVLNAGHAGAGPLFFLQQKKILEIANSAKFAIVQVMSGRSESNTLFTSKNGTAKLTRKIDGKTNQAEIIYDDFLAGASYGEIEKLVAETRLLYTQHFIELLQKIRVPKILFWFSERKPEYNQSYENARKLFGKFPHLVNSEMVEKIRPFADHYVECTTDEGMPQPLISRFTGQPFVVDISIPSGNRPKKFNAYYPSPEMHFNAFQKLWDYISTHEI